MKDKVEIFFDDRVVVLKANNRENPAINNDICHVYKNKKALAKRIKMFEESESDEERKERLFVVHNDVNELFDAFKDCFKNVEAAGGLVKLHDGRMLFIKRLGKWDLPKGKAEKGETLPETAIREVMEECGLKKKPVITGELMHTFHTYHEDGKHILKHTVWYSMLYEGDENLHPQFSENITQAVWFSENQLNVVLQNTYQSIKQVLDEL